MQICTYGFSPRETVNHAAKSFRLKRVSGGTNNNHTQGGFLTQVGVIGEISYQIAQQHDQDMHTPHMGIG